MGRRDPGRGHLALGLCLLAAAFTQLCLQPLVLRSQVLQLLLQRCAFCLNAVQKVAVDVVLEEGGRAGRGYGLPKEAAVNTKTLRGWLRPTCVSSSTTRCRSSLPSARAWASRRRTLISSSCSSPRTSFRGDSFQRPPRDRWACQERRVVSLGLLSMEGGRPSGCAAVSCPPARASPARCQRAPAAAASAPLQRPLPGPPAP